MSQVSLAFEKLLHMLRSPGESSKFLRGTAAVFIIQMAGVGTSYVMQVLLARWMGSEALGDFLYAFNWMNLLAAFGSVGLTLSVFKFVPDYMAEGKWGLLRGSIYAFSMVTIGVSILLALAAIGIFLVFPPADIDPTTLYIGLAITPLVAVAMLYMSTLRSLGHVVIAQAPINIGQSGLMVLASALTFLVTGTLTNVIAISLMGGVMLGIVVYQIIVILRKLREKAKDAKPAYEMGTWLRTSFPMLLVRSFAIIMERVDVVMVGLLLGAVPTAIYAVAARSANLASFPLTAVNSMTAPRISPLYKQGRMDDLSREIKRATALSILGTVFICTGLILFSHFLLSLFGEEFLQGQRTLFILLAGQFINASAGPVGFLMNMTGHQSVSGRIYFVSVVVNVTLNFIFVIYTDLGIEGVAISTAIALVLRNVWLYLEVRRRLHISTLPFGGRKKKTL